MCQRKREKERREKGREKKGRKKGKERTWTVVWEWTEGAGGGLDGEGKGGKMVQL